MEHRRRDRRRGRQARVTPFGERVRAARVAAGLTQRAVAAAVGVSQPAYWEYERGICVPSVGRVARLAAVLQLDPDALAALAEAARPREAEA
jgi:transcriptional regulator with XRE-family HTH domain